jgi:hypothetical protein
MPNVKNLEIAIRNAFSTLFKPGDSITMNMDNEDLDWIRCAVTEKGIAILVETDSLRSPFIRSPEGGSRVFRGAIRMEESIIEIDGKNCNFITVLCRKKSLAKVFERLAADLIIHLEENSTEITDPWDFLRERLKGWQLLFSFTDNKAEEKGLIGELLIFKILREHLNINSEAWTGPLGGTKDFMLNGCNIEVKTTTVRYGYFVEISGLFQTRTTQEAEKLAFVRMEETPQGDLSPASLVAEIIPMLNEADRVTFYNLLKEFNEDLFNSPNKYSLLEVVFFDIDHDFPRISEESFVNYRMPEGVIRLTWTADLGSLEGKQTNEALNEIRSIL